MILGLILDLRALKKAVKMKSSWKYTYLPVPGKKLYIASP
jgi:hypothetical protein